MRKRAFFLSDANEEIAGLNRRLPSSSGVFVVTGFSQAGKTTWGKGIVDKNEDALFCSAIELYAAIFIRENETFLQKAADKPLLVIDDLELLDDEKKGDSILSLLIDARKDQGKCTVCITGLSEEELANRFPSVKWKDAEFVSMLPIKHEDLEGYVKGQSECYGVDKERRLTQDAVEYLASAASLEDLKSLDDTVFFLMSIADIEGEEIDTQVVKEVLES